MIRYPLRDLVSPILSLNEYDAKAGTNDEVVVLAITVDDQEPAKELNKFIQRGFLNFLDSDVSPNPNEFGKYVVFVEFKNSDSVLDHVYKFVEDIENLTGKEKWKLKLHRVNELFDLKDPQVALHMNAKADIFQESLSLILDQIGLKYNLNESCLKIHGRPGIKCNVLSVSDAPVTALNEAYSFEKTTEKSVLSSIFFESDVSQYGKKFVVENSGIYIVVQDVEVLYS